MREIISDAQFIRSYRTAGLWFVGMYVEAFLLRFDEVEDDDKRARLIDEIYDNGRNADEDLTGARARVNLCIGL